MQILRELYCVPLVTPQRNQIIRQLARDLGLTVPDNRELRGEYWDSRRRWLFPHQPIPVRVPPHCHLHLNIVQGLSYNTRTTEHTD